MFLWILAQTAEVSSDIQVLIDFLPYLIGILVVPLVAFLKKTVPTLRGFIPYEHQKIVLTIGIAFLMAAILKLDATYKEIIDAAFQASGAAGLLYGGTKFVSKYRSKKFGNN